MTIHFILCGDGKNNPLGINVQFLSKTKLNNPIQMRKTGTIAMNQMVYFIISYRVLF